MKVCLKTIANSAHIDQHTLNLEERLPERVVSPCVISCSFQVEPKSDHYLLTYNAEGSFVIVCQRCLSHFTHQYQRQSQLAVCANEEIAETLMSSMVGRSLQPGVENDWECIVLRGDEINLQEILTDDLHLFLPEKHEHDDECDEAISHFLGQGLDCH